tara:strand:- start:110 stop:733 length:624 start_codon:yes stop_codon:yes gene_type:complete
MGYDSNVLSKNQYHVRSLYFDNFKNSGIFEKQSGILQRKKYRIRIYNLEKNIIKLERKERVGQFIRKYSSLLSYTDCQKIIDGDIICLKESNNKLQNSFYADLRSENYRPSVIVDYFREPLTYRHGNVRVTFDKNLKSGLYQTSLFDKDLKMVRVIEEPQLIMEVKYDNYLPDIIRNAIQIPSSTRYAISKFVICRKYTKLNSWEDN